MSDSGENISQFDTSAPDQDCISKLEDLLADAKAGNLIGFAASMVYTGAETGNIFHSRDPISLIGEIEIVKRELMDCEISLRMHKAGIEY